jgi:phosphatidylglycerol:prolipoprotein diacylglycerol transferase
MIAFPNISPDIVKFSLFGYPMQVRWYGVFYVLSFIIAYFLYRHNLKFRKIKLNREQYESAIFYVMVGVIVGGRLGYVVFYNLLYYLQHPIRILVTWEGGMSFHGGAIGVIVAGLLYARKNKLNFYALADAAIPIVAIGLGLGRLGNFINAELWGRPTDVPWAMIFPDSDGVPRHPTQLYELFLEGIVLATVSYILLRKLKKNGLVFYSFIGLYGIFRFLIEFVREPDELQFYEKFGFIFGFMSIGAFLSFLMIIAAAWGIWKINKSAIPPPGEIKS